LAHFEVVII